MMGDEGGRRKGDVERKGKTVGTWEQAGRGRRRKGN